MNIDEFNLPRVWTGEEYFYPVFSELGITYENPDKEFTEENIKPLHWAFGWHFGAFVKDENSKDGYKYIQNPDGDINYDYELERCTGKTDKQQQLIYENDVVSDECGNTGIVFFSRHFLEWRIAWYVGRSDLVNHCGYGVRMFDWVYPVNALTIIGNIHNIEEAKTVKLIKD